MAQVDACLGKNGGYVGERLACLFLYSALGELACCGVDEALGALSECNTFIFYVFRWLMFLQFM